MREEKQRQRSREGLKEIKRKRQKERRRRGKRTEDIRKNRVTRWSDVEELRIQISFMAYG